jgi:hypothetical protein
VRRLDALNNAVPPFDQLVPDEVRVQILGGIAHGLREVIRRGGGLDLLSRSTLQAVEVLAEVLGVRFRDLRRQELPCERDVVGKELAAGEPDMVVMLRTVEPNARAVGGAPDGISERHQARPNDLEIGSTLCIESVE